MFTVVFRVKREERVERQQEQLKKITNDMDEWRKELTVFRKEVRQLLSHTSLRMYRNFKVLICGNNL